MVAGLYIPDAWCSVSMLSSQSSLMLSTSSSSAKSVTASTQSFVISPVSILSSHYASGSSSPSHLKRIIFSFTSFTIVADFSSLLCHEVPHVKNSLLPSLFTSSAIHLSSPVASLISGQTAAGELAFSSYSRNIRFLLTFILYCV